MTAVTSVVILLSLATDPDSNHGGADAEERSVLVSGFRQIREDHEPGGVDYGPAAPWITVPRGLYYGPERPALRSRDAWNSPGTSGSRSLTA